MSLPASMDRESVAAWLMDASGVSVPVESMDPAMKAVWLREATAVIALVDSEKAALQARLAIAEARIATRDARIAQVDALIDAYHSSGAIDADPRSRDWTPKMQKAWKRLYAYMADYPPKSDSTKEA